MMFPKRYLQKSFVCLLMVFGLLCCDAKAQENELALTISGIKESKGILRVALCDTQENYDKDGRDAYKTVLIEVETTSNVVHVFKDLPFGQYAIKIYHDINDNGEIDKGLFGIPKEPYGFSNNARGKMGPPSFQEAQFTFDAEMNKVEIMIK